MIIGSTCRTYADLMLTARSVRSESRPRGCSSDAMRANDCGDCGKGVKSHVSMERVSRVNDAEPVAL